MPVAVPGESPGTMMLSRRGTIAAPGTIRRFWKQSVGYVGAQAPFSWTANAHVGVSGARGFQVKRALRYMTRSVTHTAGTDNTRFAGLHTQVTQSGRKRQTVVLGAGRVRNRPTVRNRMTSFGSRVPTLNSQVEADQGAQAQQ